MKTKKAKVRLQKMAWYLVLGATFQFCSLLPAIAQSQWKNRVFEQSFLVAADQEISFKGCTFRNKNLGLQVSEGAKVYLDSCFFDSCLTGMQDSSHLTQLRHCRFLNCQTGIQSTATGGFRVSYCRFENSQTAISLHASRLKPQAKDSLLPVLLYGNDFQNNQTAITLTADPSRSRLLDVDFYCNRFIPATRAKTSIGLHIGKEVRLWHHALCGEFDSDFPKPPCGNIWPIQGKINRHYYPGSWGGMHFYCEPEDEEMCWKSPPGWVSIAYHGMQPYRYFRYQNEFVETEAWPGGKGRGIETVTVSHRGFTVANGLDKETARGVFLCDTVPWAGETAYFPVEIRREKYLERQPESASSNWMGKHRWRDSVNLDIPYQCPRGKKGEILLQTTDLIQTLYRFPLSEKKGYFDFNTNGLKPGVYAYILLVDGEPVQTRKLVVVR